MFTVEVDDDYSNDREMVLVVESTDPRATYGSAARAVHDWLDEVDLEGWSLDSEMYRIGVGVTAVGGGAGAAARFIVSLTRHSSLPSTP